MTQPVLYAAMESSADPDSNAFLKFSLAPWHVLQTRTFFSLLLSFLRFHGHGHVHHGERQRNTKLKGGEKTITKISAKIGDRSHNRDVVVVATRPYQHTHTAPTHTTTHPPPDQGNQLQLLAPDAAKHQKKTENHGRFVSLHSKAGTPAREPRAAEYQ